ncbi:MAG TPA: hypothetical protein VNM92_05110 [Thermoanaerobaculia bacterium]|nr:hypothetical protein [Thermoanaerobaculia bacterium]
MMMKRLTLIAAIIGIAAPAYSAAQRLEASVSRELETGTYLCSASLVEIPSKAIVAAQNVRSAAGEVGVAVSGHEDAVGTGAEYRLTCTVEEGARFATVELAVKNFSDGVLGAYSSHSSRVPIK